MVGAETLLAAGAQLSVPQDPPQQELVGSQQKRLRNSRCKKPSRLQASQLGSQLVLHESQVEQELQAMLLKQRWCTLLSRQLSWQQLSLQQGLGQAGWQGCSQTVTGTLRQTLTQTVSGTQTAIFLQTVQGTVSHTV